MARVDANTQAHLDWMGFVQPHGLVVSAPALNRAGVILNRSDSEGQELLGSCVEERRFGNDRTPSSWIPDFRVFARRVLGWKFSPKAYARADVQEQRNQASAGFSRPAGPALSVPEIVLDAYGETLRPDFGVLQWPRPTGDSPQWQLLVRLHSPEQGLDSVEDRGSALDATPQGRMERLLRGTGTPAGVICNGRTLRLISAPHGESSGWIDFRVADMLQTAGRPIASAMRLLLGESRLLTAPPASRLTALLQESRKYQNEVSERLAEQVLHALYELVHGFQMADISSGRELLREPLDRDPDEVYRALLTVLLRLVFLLYAEQRDLLPDDETFVRYYSLAGLYERLREDAAHNPDTMDQRYGAWAQLAVLFRIIHEGANSGAMKLPARKGDLFDPNRYEFLEGRSVRDNGASGQAADLPRVPDGTIHRVLEKLLVLDGERISYRALDVEQIGSVYETMMGFQTSGHRQI